MTQETWTPEQMQVEFDHIMETRLAILCGTGEPDAEQFAMALAEADDACEELKRQAQPEIKRRKIEL